MRPDKKEDGKRNCIACGNPLEGGPLMEFENMPASAQDIPDREQIKRDHGITLRLHQCRCCGLVQFDCRPVAYYRDVIRSGGFNTTMVELRKKQYAHLISTYNLEGKKFIEAGCGRGEFLSVLGQFPVKAYGVEHKEDLVEIAKSQGLNVWRGFTEEQSTDLGGEQGEAPFDVFLSFNFLEHQPDPVTMLTCISNNLTENGMGLVTVPSLEYILKYDGYYELIRDHLAYYTFETLRFVLERGGFEVLSREIINRDTLSVIVKKKKAGTVSRLSARDGQAVDPAAIKSAGYTVSPVDLTGMSHSRQAIRRQMDQLEKKVGKGRKLAVWGAGHQGFTLAATTDLGAWVSYIIDSAPFKQGRFAPASHIPIVAPDHYFEEPVETILIVAPGYTEEIFRVIRERYGEKVDIWTLRSNQIERLERV